MGRRPGVGKPNLPSGSREIRPPPWKLTSIAVKHSLLPLIARWCPRPSLCLVRSLLAGIFHWNKKISLPTARKDTREEVGGGGGAWGQSEYVSKKIIKGQKRREMSQTLTAVHDVYAHQNRTVIGSSAGQRPRSEQLELINNSHTPEWFAVSSDRSKPDKQIRGGRWNSRLTPHQC